MGEAGGAGGLGGPLRRIAIATFRHPDGREHEFEIKDEADTVAVLALTDVNVGYLGLDALDLL